MVNTKMQGKAKLSMQVLNAASQGDTEAIRLVLKNYEGYIKTLSTVRFYDEDGRVYLFIDETLQRELELLLIVKVMRFKHKKLPA